jgi:hypothetical protein
MNPCSFLAPWLRSLNVFGTFLPEHQVSDSTPVDRARQGNKFLNQPVPKKNLPSYIFELLFKSKINRRPDVSRIRPRFHIPEAFVIHKIIHTIP